jgi:hypothetical protein
MNYSGHQKYKLLVKRFEVEVGTICYIFDGHDFGCAREDSYYTRIPHTSVTLDPKGDYPFFTVPSDHLEIIK